MGESSSNSAAWLSCARTKAALDDLGEVLHSLVDPEDLELRVVALHVLERGGKRLRPALLLLAAGLGPVFELDVLLRAAAALELTHVASLYHDDIMDRAPMRRGVPSASALFGNTMATLGGIYLFAKAGDLWASLGNQASELAGRAAEELCLGQLREVENAFNLELEESEHIGILGRKTGTLFALPCEMGGILSGATPEATVALATFGRDIGVAFQLVDDALDLQGDEQEVGKATANDLREGVYSLAVLRALRSASMGERLADLLTQTRLEEATVTEAISLVRSSGAVEGVLELARSYAASAKSAIAVFPPGPEVESLRELADHAVARSH